MLKKQRLYKTGKYLFLCFITLVAFSFPLPGKAREVTLEYNGLTLNANLEIAEGKDAKDGMVLIVHGYLGHNKMEIIETAQQALLDNEYSSLAINLSLRIDNRHGFYECTRPHMHTQENAVQEISAWINWLRLKGTTQIAIMGHSRGANISMVYAVEQIDPEVNRLVFLAPGVGENLKQLYHDRYGKNYEEILAYAESKKEADKGNEFMEGVDLLGCAKARVSPNSFISYYRKNNKFRRFKEILPKISIPTLIIAGSLDERQPNIPELLESIVDNDRINLLVIEGAGHFFNDFNIEEAMEAAVEFIDVS
jgi:pimeloyl-ACP methyl ester carboxylesterase